jgi:hypothetical protein
MADGNRELQTEIERLQKALDEERSTKVVASLENAVEVFDRLSDEIVAAINDQPVPVSAPVHGFLIRRAGKDDVAVYQKMQQIGPAQLNTLAPDVRQMVHTYEIAMKALEAEWARIKHEQPIAQLDPKVRQKQMALIRQMKVELMGIIDFLGAHGVYLDDHYQNVRYLISTL